MSGGDQRATLARDLLKLASRPHEVALVLLEGDSDPAEVAAELEDVANRFLDISEVLSGLRAPGLSPRG